MFLQDLILEIWNKTLRWERGGEETGLPKNLGSSNAIVVDEKMIVYWIMDFIIYVSSCRIVAEVMVEQI